jgi:spermidine synthase
MRLYYDGLVVHQSQSDDGVIEVVDDGDIRSLHFGTFPRQSCMSLQTPHTLELTYTQAMMAALLLNPEPERVLIVGLGGGSLVKFILHHFPNCQIDVVEYRQDVLKVAYDYFQLPENDSRVNVHIGDGYLFGIQAFFDACAGLLTSNGVMSINLWGTNRPVFKQTMARINESFDGKSLILPVEDKGNVIVLATIRLVSQANLKKLKLSVALQEEKLQIKLAKLLYELIRRNRPYIGKLFF